MSSYHDVQGIRANTNMLQVRFHICPICENIISSVGSDDLTVSCHGMTLTPLVPKSVDDAHAMRTSCTGDELLIEASHPMSKEHHIMFVAVASPDCVQVVRLYPEGSAEAHFRRSGVRDLYILCNEDGLHSVHLRDILH